MNDTKSVDGETKAGGGETAGDCLSSEAQAGSSQPAGKSDGESTASSDAEPAQFVDSAGEQRVVNNTMRHQYRQLTEVEKAQMLAVKDAGLAFITLLHELGNTDPAGPHFAGRYALAATNAEQAVMWAVKHLTR